MNKFKRGSEWGKWDLHVHTPETRLNNQYSTTDEQDVWDLFCKKIEESDVSVFGITDYFSIDNYLLLLKNLKINIQNQKKCFSLMLS